MEQGTESVRYWNVMKLIYSHKRFIRLLCHYGHRMEWMFLPSILKTKGVRRYIPVTKVQDQYSHTYDDPIDAITRIVYGDPATMNVRRRWGMDRNKMRDLLLAIQEGPNHDPKLRESILEAIGLEEVPAKERRK